MPVALVGLEQDVYDLRILKAAEKERPDFEKRLEIGGGEKNAFNVQGVADFFRKQNVDYIIICGYDAIYCAVATAKGAVDNGFGVIIGTKTVFGADYLRHKKFFKRAMAFFGMAANAAAAFWFYARNAEIHMTMTALLDAIYSSRKD